MFDESKELIEQYPMLHQYTQEVKKAERAIVGREKEIRRILAAFCRPELCNVILLGEAGSGKALADDTPIAVNDHRIYVEIKDLKLDDEVFDEQGNVCKVVGVYPQGLLEAYRVTFSDGSSLICNDEHLWFARTRKQHYDDKEFRVKTLKEMMAYGIQGRIKQGGYYKFLPNWYVPANKALDRPGSNFSVPAYLMGVLLSRKAAFDSMNNIKIVTKDADLIDHIIQSVKRKRSIFHRMADDTCYSLLIKNTFNGLDEKFVRNELKAKRYLLGSVSQRYDLLRGLMDADGTVIINNRIDCRYVTKSSDMVQYVRELCNSLGIRVMTTDYNFDTGRIIVHFDMNDEDKLNIFTCRRHLDRIKINIEAMNRKFHKKRDDFAIVNVEKLNKTMSMTCIKVNSPNHVFQAGKCHVVTHNTMLVQGTMAKDTSRLYIEVDLARMIADLHDSNEMAAKLKKLFDEVSDYHNKFQKEIVLFIDEFHQIVQLSNAAVEALKPLLADSGTRGIRVIAATTYIEFRKYIAPNQPLVERLQRINLEQPNRKMTINILKGMAERYGVLNDIYDESIFGLIYDYTNRYIPANAQPRKSILILDLMVGWHRAENRVIDKKLLADCIYETEGVNVAFRVDAQSIKNTLDKYVLSQGFVTRMIEQRLQLNVADLNDKTKPMATFLFTGSTGVGKTEIAKRLADILFGKNSRSLIRFDMSEYANPDSLNRFKNELTAKVWERPYSIILLDEIEKACGVVTRLLLQVLDDGRLMDENNREVSFINSYIIMTTNAGSEVYSVIAQYETNKSADDKNKYKTDAEIMQARQEDEKRFSKVVKEYDKLIRASLSSTTGENKFPAEILGRIDCIVPFQPLSEATMMAIALMKLEKLKLTVLKTHGIKLEIDKAVVDFVVKDNMSTDSNAGGARRVVNTIESEVTTKVASYINAYPDTRAMKVFVKGKMAFSDKTMLESDAIISIVGQK